MIEITLTPEQVEVIKIGLQLLDVADIRGEMSDEEEYALEALMTESVFADSPKRLP
jgi:hypothetical protein